MRSLYYLFDPRVLLAIFLACVVAIAVVYFDRSSIYFSLLNTIPALSAFVTYSVGLVIPMIGIGRLLYNEGADRFYSPTSGRFVASKIPYFIAIVLVIAWYFLGIPWFNNGVEFGLYNILQPSLSGIFGYLFVGLISLIVIIPSMILIAMPRPGMIFRSVFR